MDVSVLLDVPALTIHLEAACIISRSPRQARTQLVRMARAEEKFHDRGRLDPQ